MKRSMASSEAKSRKRNCFEFSGCASDDGRFWRPNTPTTKTHADVPPDVSLSRRASARFSILKVDQSDSEMKRFFVSVQVKILYRFPLSSVYVPALLKFNRLMRRSMLPTLRHTREL